MAQKYEKLTQIYKGIWDGCLFIEAIYNNSQEEMGKILLQNNDNIQLFNYYIKALDEFEIKNNHMRWIIEEGNIILDDKTIANVNKFSECFFSIIKSIHLIKMNFSKESETENIKRCCEGILDIRDEL